MFRFVYPFGRAESVSRDPFSFQFFFVFFFNFVRIDFSIRGLGAMENFNRFVDFAMSDYCFIQGLVGYNPVRG